MMMLADDDDDDDDDDGADCVQYLHIFQTLPASAFNCQVRPSVLSLPAAIARRRPRPPVLVDRITGVQSSPWTVKTSDSINSLSLSLVAVVVVFDYIH